MNMLDDDVNDLRIITSSNNVRVKDKGKFTRSQVIDRGDGSGRIELSGTTIHSEGRESATITLINNEGEITILA